MHRLVGRTYDEVVGKDGHLTQYYMFDLAKAADGMRIHLCVFYIHIYIYIYLLCAFTDIHTSNKYTSLLWRLLPRWSHTPCFPVPVCVAVCRWGGRQGGLQRRERHLPTLRAARHVRTRFMDVGT